MIPGRDPAAMSANERLAEIATLLARGYSRSCANAHTGAGIAAPVQPDANVRVRPRKCAANQLADLGEDEPSCVRAAQTARSEES